MSGARRYQLQVVWFKRDLRVADHAVLAAASQAGPVLPLYIIEPELWRQPDMSARQWAFAAECLGDLQQDLADLGQPLCLRSGDAVDVLAELQAAHGMDALWSHEETGNAWTYARDQRVAAWCRDRGIAWHEMPQNGVIRRLKSRTGWAKAWDRRMAEPQVDAPALEPVDVETGGVPTAADLHMGDDGCTQRQIGGRAVAVDLLHSFLARRGETYRSAMANPIQGAEACSRLSPHLAWGTVSMREVSQATRARAETAEGAWKGAMTSFNGRLHWHCHFMQKLEDAPRLEFENLHPAYNGLRPSMPDAARLAAWEAGETGLPFVDACMRSLRATGWLNFRMRAMLIAVASYHLWLDWRRPGEHLARLFTDYEAGIHWPQVQMQSGTTGINTVRIYNPVKQGKDQDPTGVFTRQWVPELRDIPTPMLQEPWRADAAPDVLGKTYPFPIVDHLEAAKAARQRVWGVRSNAAFRSKADAIQDKHGSRKSRIPMRGRKPKAAASQLDLFPEGPA